LLFLLPIKKDSLVEFLEVRHATKSNTIKYNSTTENKIVGDIYYLFT
jgi:hypothetical protein